jgi:3-phosphoshikimate 1-carboxyvinyltransferase
VNLQKKNGDTLIWNGKTETPEASPMIDTYEDHRMAMAFAPCAFSHERLSINNPEVVSKSYPRFWKDLLHAGFTILNE